MSGSIHISPPMINVASTMAMAACIRGIITPSVTRWALLTSSDDLAGIALRVGDIFLMQRVAVEAHTHLIGDAEDKFQCRPDQQKPDAAGEDDGDREQGRRDIDQFLLISASEPGEN